MFVDIEIHASLKIYKTQSKNLTTGKRNNNNLSAHASRISLDVYVGSNFTKEYLGIVITKCFVLHSCNQDIFSLNLYMTKSFSGKGKLAGIQQCKHMKMTMFVIRVYDGKLNALIETVPSHPLLLHL